MSLCFLTGSDDRRLVVHDVLEHLSFDRDHNVEITADFLVEYVDDEETGGDQKESALYLLHRGDFEPTDASIQWLHKNSEETAAARKVFETHFAEFEADGGLCKVRRSWGESSEMFAVSAQKELQPVEELPASLTGPNGRLFTPFTFFKTEPFEVGERRLIRLKGGVTSTNLESFAIEPNRLPLFGEGRLITEFRSWLPRVAIKIVKEQRHPYLKYLTVFERFVENLRKKANFYHFVFDLPSQDIMLPPFPITRDLVVGLREFQVCDEGRITWIRSTAADFGQRDLPKAGPIVVARFPGLGPGILTIDDMLGPTPDLTDDRICASDRSSERQGDLVGTSAESLVGAGRS